MGLRIVKPWTKLEHQAIAGLSAQLGVYELSDPTGTTIKIGYAGGSEPFGMRSALAAAVGGPATHFRYEFTHGYLTRWQELLMIHQADHGALPTANEPDAYRVGRLSVEPERRSR